MCRGEKGLQRQVTEKLQAFFETQRRISVVYLFGSSAKGNRTAESDVDIAVLLSEAPGKMLGYYLHLIDEVSRISSCNVDLVILNTAPQFLGIKS